MPSPSTPKQANIGKTRKITPSTLKTKEPATPLGVHDNSFVRDRVRQWQSQGGGVVIESDVAAEEADDLTCHPLQQEHSSRKPRASSAKPKDVVTSPKTPTKKLASIANTPKAGEENGPQRARTNSAPTKRVISDGHWRKKRSPPQKASSSARHTRNASSKPSAKNISPKISPSNAKFDRQHKRRSGGLHIAEDDVSADDGTCIDDGIRVYSAPSSSFEQRGVGHRSQKVVREQRTPGTTEHRKVHRRTPSPPQCKSLDEQPRRRSGGLDNVKEAYEDPMDDSISQRDYHRKPAAGDGSHSSTYETFKDGRNASRSASARSRRSNLLSHAFGSPKKLFARPPASPASEPRVPSIESWLKDTPDPFVDAEDNQANPEPELPMRPSAQSDGVIVETRTHSTKDPNEIWEALDTKEGTRRHVNGSKKKRRVPSSSIYEGNPFPADFQPGPALQTSSNRMSSGPKSVLDGAPDLSPTPSSLRRRGAKRSSPSPTRERAKSLYDNDRHHSEDFASVKEATKSESPQSEAGDIPAPLRPPGRGSRRPIPTTGAHPLSTIASMSTLNSKASQSLASGSVVTASDVTVKAEPEPAVHTMPEERDNFDPTSLERTRSRIAKHSDLMSVLSLPPADNKSIRSARSIRTNKSRLATATVDDILKELIIDEEKYMREVRTLVDGVIPVLLTCALSKSNSSTMAGLFGSSNSVSGDPTITKPIIDMGVALERLKTLHKRIPRNDSRALMTWAHGAQRVYNEYIKVWRMGFQDVVVNLAPATEENPSRATSDQNNSLDEGLPRNTDGDIVNGEGERVDVAYLLKRPLVRLKYLQKTLKGINIVSPSTEAETLAIKFQELVTDARNRANEEKARIEDEAASNIDPSRSRDLRTLAPLVGVKIDRRRHVRARDNFNLSLQHSNGQRIDCRTELILRDDAVGTEGVGDLLICEVEGKERWLLHPPVLSNLVSARNGDKLGEIIIMIRGFSTGGAGWHELLTLRAEEEQVGFDWVQMLGLDPVPPQITRSQSFVSRRGKRRSYQDPGALLNTDTDTGINHSTESSVKSRTPSPREVDIPIGEKAHTESKQWADTAPLPAVAPATLETHTVEQSKEVQPQTPVRPSTNYVDHVNDLRSLPSSRSPRSVEKQEKPKSSRTLAGMIGLHGTSAMSGIRRAKAKRASRSGESSPYSPVSPLTPQDDDSPNRANTPEEAISMDSSNSIYHNLPRSTSPPRVSSPEPRVQRSEDSRTPTRPAYQRSHSSVPSTDPPKIPKLRKNSPPVTPVEEPEAELDWPMPEPDKIQEDPQKNLKSPSRLNKKRPVSLDSHTTKDVPPPPPAHRSSSSVQLQQSSTPVLSPFKQKHRRSSSPLKHQYEPSTASESSSDSDASTIEHNVSGSVSDISSDDEFDQVPMPAPLALKPAFSKQTPPASVYSGAQGTLAPSNSASQAPYKTVPPQPTKANKTIASIFAWSDKGAWDSLHPDECSITITPGLIEVHEMSSAHSKLKPPAASMPITDDDAFSQLSSNLTSVSDKSQPERPLIALELTPHVTLRHGTAIDICVRSPPTPASRLAIATNNVMFRSRNPEECEALYALLNHARIHNPTYIALMNARPRDPSSFGVRPTSAAGSTRSSWFGGWGRSNSYRASTNGRPSSVAQSDNSIGSMASAFSALKHFKPNAGGLFNIARSTVTSRVGSGANSIYSSSDSMNSSGYSGAASPSIPAGVASDGIGLTGMIIRLYERETASKWRQMGSAKLTIMRPPLLNTQNTNTQIQAPSSSSESMASDSRPSSSHGPPPSSATSAPRPSSVQNPCKRILIQGKTRGEILLDVILGEDCFERVSRTGIAVKVWEDVVGPNGELGVVNAVGGVVAGRMRVYMIQVSFPGECEEAMES